jgi:hypothetical protein
VSNSLGQSDWSLAFRDSLSIEEKVSDTGDKIGRRFLQNHGACMSYRKAADLLRFAIDLSSSHIGLTLAEIDERSTAQGASARRNTQRLLDAVREVFGDKLAETLDCDGRKRVRLVKANLRPLVDLEAGELASLDHAISALRAQNNYGAGLRLTMRRFLEPKA